MKMQQQNSRLFSFHLSQIQLFLWVVAMVVTIGLAFGFGYFWGRYEQIQINKSLLKPIPDVNCPQRIQ